MGPLARVEAAMQIIDDAWYRISTSEVVPDAPDRTMRSFGTFDFFEGDVFVDTGTTTRDVEIAVEEWDAEPPLLISDGGGFAEVVEISVPFEVARLRVLEASGSQALALEFEGGEGCYRLRLYARYLDPRRQRHLLRLWPAPAAREWIYQLDDDAQPVERPDRSGTETFAVTMTAGQATVVRREVDQMAIMETQTGDIDDIVEDCLQISAAIESRAAPAGEAAVALTVRQWKVALAVLDQRALDVGDPDWAREIRRVHDVIDAQIGERLPPGRVLGL
ncbi:hypothetical protein E1287_40810 [Actinomadura sp. KC06]|uniref:hypothetical protein n=1 Tax=Actinomadura sp. KC06 TaxID=2530369 RepID=UPI00104ED588|nr:hypothetical protein [Actinomadura sp. KC06]TDD21192.1 hypothetical protein E1287_40810 [Actinomadura sp. KC06]